MDTQKHQSAFRFTNPMLLESIYMANPNYDGDMGSVGSTNFKINVLTSPTEKQANGKLVATVSESLMTSENIDQSKATPFYLRVTMSAKFEWSEDDVPKDQASLFLKINAPSFLLSYIRPVVANLTEQAAIQTQHIPFIDFAHAMQQKKDKHKGNQGQ
ncbi:protein-export chaperone SecB [Lacticaseibacillus paracasei]|uniref:protein-export chaperone SecB n=1 Tax=Lacticaseibacillus paracasei TaxID=1597 RepID=UPI00404589D9